MLQFVSSRRVFGALVLLAASAFVALPARPQSAAAPAAGDISGTWNFVYNTDGGDRDSSAEFKQQGDQVTGKWNKTADVQGTFKDGQLDLAFPYDSEEAGMKATLKMKGKLQDGKLVGNWEFGDYSGTFIGTRGT